MNIVKLNEKEFTELPTDITLNPNENLYLDTETDGLYGAIQFISLYQASWGDNVVGIRTHKWDTFSFTKFLKLIQDYNIIGANLAYDMSCFNYNFPKWDDTFLAGRLAMPYLKSFSLDSMLNEVLGFDPYKDVGIDKKDTAKSDYGSLLITKTQWAYACLDVFHLDTLWNKVKFKADDINYILDKHIVNYCINDLQPSGLPIDLEAMEAFLEKCSIKDAEFEEQFIERGYKGLNVNSWKQVRTALDVDESSADFLLRYSVDEENPQDKRELCQIILDKRKNLKLMSFIKKMDKDRIYGYFAPNTKSGRMKSDNTNLQQLPRKLKPIIGFSEDSGMLLVDADFSSLEMRTLAATIGEHKMIKLMQEDGDLHTFTGQYLFSKDVLTTEERYIAKVCNFLLLYGGSEYILQSTLLGWTGTLYSIKQCRDWKKGWNRLYSDIASWHEDANRAFNYGRSRQPQQNHTPLGREYFADRIQDYLNIKNQGAGAEVSKFSWHYMTPKIKALQEQYPEADIKMVNMVHDSFTFQCVDDKKYYAPLAKIIAESMLEGWTEWSKLVDYRVPMPVTCSAGYNWKSVDEEPIYSYMIDYKGNRTEEIR